MLGSLHLTFLGLVGLDVCLSLVALSRIPCSLVSNINTKPKP